MSENGKDHNLDQEVIDGFGQEWATFNYTDSDADEALDAQFLAYTAPIDLTSFNNSQSFAADFGAGSGRWTSRLSPHFLKIYALEPSDGAVAVLKSKFSSNARIEILQETVGVNSIPYKSLDLAVSLGVLHHIPDTAQAIRDIGQKLKPGGIFLCYLYYQLENKPLVYRMLFWASNLLRIGISHLPHGMRKFVANIIATTLYFPLARISRFFGDRGKDISNFPLHHYAYMPFVMLQNDALDRFGTRLEQRFSREEISEMLRKADFDTSTLNFSDSEPFWTFSVVKL
jgi:SAM-dependent methyltransferase